jgi:hypothetical protein
MVIPKRNVNRILFMLLAICFFSISATELIADELSQARQRAVVEAWKREQSLVQKSGNGSRDWTRNEKSELLKYGRVSGYEGHHINDVSTNPKLAGNPDNIKFVKGRQEHLKEHDGNFKNPTSGPLIPRSKPIVLGDHKTGNTAANPSDDHKTGNIGDAILAIFSFIGVGVLWLVKSIFGSGVADSFNEVLVGIGTTILGWFGIKEGRKGRKSNSNATGAGCLTIIVGISILIFVIYILYSCFK